MYTHVESLPLLLTVWVCTFNNLLLTAIYTWFILYINLRSTFHSCQIKDEFTGARCASGNHPHNHLSSRTMPILLLFGSYFHPSPALTVATMIESIAPNYHMIVGPRFFFEREWSAYEM